MGGPAGPSSTGTHFSEQCVSELHGLETWTTEDGTLELSVELLKYAVDQVWLLVAAIWVFQMQTGFTLLEAGGVRVKNTKAIIIKNFLDTCLGALVWYFVGYPLGYSDGNAFLGYTWDSLSSCTDHVHWFFTWSFAATSATILSGAVAERCQMQAYLVIAAVLTGVVHPVCAHWVWTSEGWLSPGKMGPNGFIDTAGSGVVHLVGGVAALAAAAILGPRHNWTAVESSGPLFTGHSSVLTTLGTFILWVSWYAFNCASVAGVLNVHKAGRMAVSTTLCAASAALVSSALSSMHRHSLDVTPLTNGVLAGLVASCAGGSSMPAHFALISGLAAGAIYHGASRGIKRLGIDDPLDAVAVHLFGGAWGCVSVGLFATRDEMDGASDYGLMTGGGGLQFGIQLLGVLAIAGWAAAIITPLTFALYWGNFLRVPLGDELAGLDRASHGGLAYVDGADPMRKSARPSTQAGASSPTQSPSGSPVARDSRKTENFPYHSLRDPLRRMQAKPRLVVFPATSPSKGTASEIEHSDECMDGIAAAFNLPLTEREWGSEGPLVEEGDIPGMVSPSSS